MLNRVGPVPSRAHTAPHAVPATAPGSRRLIDRVTRRHLLGAAASVVLAAAGLFRAVPEPPEPVTEVPPDDPPFDQMYQGRRIQGEPMASRGVDRGVSGEWRVTIDGRLLGLMRRADGTYLSMVDHYQSYATPLAAARGAVDELGPHEVLSGRHH
ncbi:tyrosinase family oxidase copper chaperone [Streptomyces sp. NPDC052114]|uniref:tyrosinase family oxidase copper chaperone n=1 Tax=unclassified Streptomyces TaxID=2593676 RepID=UPI00341FE5F1